MKKMGFGLLMLIMALGSSAQNKLENTLLWQISGNGLEKPSYLFGTIHMICGEDAVLSDSLISAIHNSDAVYLEVEMDNLFELMGVMTRMKMNGDTTLADLLSKKDYEKVKKYFEEKSSLLPFSMLETYKPLLASSLLMEGNVSCNSPKAMEEIIMGEAKNSGKKIKGLETMSYQMSIFDSIPYKLQAEQLVKYVDDANKGKNDDQDYDKLLEAYKEQNLTKLEQLIKTSDVGLSNFTDILLYNRNRNWVEKLKGLMVQKSLVVAVGAGHLPGEKGVINLLRKAGYTLKPVVNKVVPKNQI